MSIIARHLEPIVWVMSIIYAVSQSEPLLQQSVTH